MMGLMKEVEEGVEAAEGGLIRQYFDLLRKLFLLGKSEQIRNRGL